MKKINWLYLGIGAVVLYFIWKHFNSEEKVYASGRKCPCKFGDKVIYLDCKKKNCVGCCDIVNKHFEKS